MEVLKNFMIAHDHSKPFFIIYLGLSIGLSVIFNLGFFIVLVILHYAMDFAKYKLYGLKNSKAIFYSTKDCLIDIAFVFIGLALAIVIHHGLGVGVARAASAARAGRATGVVRAEAGISRAAGLFRVIRQTALIRGVRVLKLIPKIMLGKHVAEETAGTIDILRGKKVQTKFTPTPLSKLDWTMVLISLFCVSFIILSPLIFNVNSFEIFETIKKESIPSFEIAIE